MEQALNALFKAVSVWNLKSYTGIGSDKLSKLSTNTMLYLELISYSEENTVSDMAQTLGISKAAVTMKMNDLEAHGLIERVQSPQDGRVHYIRLSPMAKIFSDEGDQLFAEIHKELEAQFSPEARETFARMTDFIARKIQEETAV